MPILVPAATSVPLSEVKQHLQMSLAKTNNDDEVLRFLKVAESAIGHRVGPLVPVTVTERHDGGQDCIILRQPRAVALTSVTYTDGTTTTLAGFDLDPDTGILYWGPGTVGRFAYGRRNVVVTYTAGWVEVPPDLKQAVKELVLHLWKTQRGGASSTRPSLPGAEDDPMMVGGYASWPPNVQELVEPYRVLSVA